MNALDHSLPLPKAGLGSGQMPGHWLLARLGKRVLRPGGLELTGRMLRELAIGESDAVVEFAPGLGVTTRLVLQRRPRSYTAIERDEAASCRVRNLFTQASHQCLTGSAAAAKLPAASATVVYGEAMLTMQGAEQKSQIIGEAARLLTPEGRYGIHELCLVPDDLAPAAKQEIERALFESIRVGARPLTVPEWRKLLEAEGFSIEAEARRPMGLLTPRRLMADEGLVGTLRILCNLCRDAEARQRVFAMRRVFQKYRRHLAAIMLVGRKGSGASP